VTVADNRVQARIGQRDHVIAVEDKAGPRSGPTSEPTRSIRVSAPQLRASTASDTGEGSSNVPRQATAGLSLLPLRRLWAGLPITGQIAAVAGTLLVLVVIITVAAAGGQRDERSYAAGLEGGRMYGRTFAVLSGSSTTNEMVESSCDTRTSIAALEGVYWS
jgi:hypothetical protein